MPGITVNRHIRQSDLVWVPPAGGAAPSLSLDFNDGGNLPSSLGLTCGGDALDGAGGNCATWSTAGFRNQSYDSTGGVGGTGAIKYTWVNPLPAGNYSPLWTNTVPITRYFRLQYDVKQSGIMHHTGSAVKLLRIFATDPAQVFIGTMESLNDSLVWFWEGWTGTRPVSAVPLGLSVYQPPGTSFHQYRIEVDYRDTTTLTVVFYLDGVKYNTVTESLSGGASDLMTGHTTLTFSPFVETYSGEGGITTGGTFVVDNFKFWDLT